LSRELSQHKDHWKLVQEARCAHDTDIQYIQALLNTIQTEVNELDANPYYKSAYCAQERLYWFHVPLWIFEDWVGKPVQRALDIGCAYGTLALFCKKLLNSDVYCIDFTDLFLSKSLSAKYDFHFEVNNIELNPFPWNHQFDVILLTEVLEHFNFNPIPTLTKIGKMLTQEGRLYLTTPDASMWGRQTKYYDRLEAIPLPTPGSSVIDDHIWQYNEEELRSVVHQAGLKVDRLAFAPGATGARHFNLTLSKNEALP
jgi:SAM-dependent methyltransferase